MEKKKTYIMFIFVIVVILIAIIISTVLPKKKEQKAEEPKTADTDAGLQIEKPLDVVEIEDHTAYSTYDESLIEDTVDRKIEMTDKEWSEIPEDEKYEDPKGDASNTWDPSSDVPPTKKQALDTVIRKVTDAADGAGIFEFVPEVQGEPVKNDMGGFSCNIVNQCGTTVFVMETDSDGKIHTTLKGSVYHEHFPGLIYNTDDAEEGENSAKYGELIEKVLIDNLFIRHVLKVDSVNDNEAYLHDMDDEPYHMIFDGTGSGKLYKINDKGEDIDLYEEEEENE